MTMRKRDGRWYGTIDVLLIREVTDEDEDTYTETVHGTQSPFGCVMVPKFEGSYYIEKPDSFWEERGFTITRPDIWYAARASLREIR